jgi:GT2 family glycosyltransferase
LLIGRKLGQARAYNDVFRAVETPYVAWLSDDNEVVNGGIDVAVGIMDRHAEVGMVGLKVRDREGSFAHASYIGGISPIGILNVNQGVLRTDVLRSVGYFSEAFGFYGIDPDLTAKVLYAGHDVVYTRAVAVHHYRAEDALKPPKGEDPRRRQSLDLYARKYAQFTRRDARWERKKRVWLAIREQAKRLRDPHSERPFLAGIFRDWLNAFSARYVSVVDPWTSLGRNFHLRQHVRRNELPKSLPPDPV